MGYYYCVDCDRQMDSGDICGGCDKGCNEDYICDRCTSDRQKNPHCQSCMKGCSKCNCVGDDLFDNTSNDIGFEECECGDCPMNCAFSSRDKCEACFTEMAEEYGCADGCKVWVVAECGHTTCTAFQASEETPEGECPNCYGETIYAEKKAAEAVYKAKEAQAEVKDAPSIKKLLSTVTSESAKEMLTKWVNDHPIALAAASANSKRKR